MSRKQMSYPGLRRLFLIAATALTAIKRDNSFLGVALATLFEHRGVPHRLRTANISEMLSHGKITERQARAADELLHGTRIEQICGVIVEDPFLLIAALKTIDRVLTSRRGRPRQRDSILAVAAKMVKTERARLRAEGNTRRIENKAIDNVLESLQAQEDEEIKQACLTVGEDPYGDLANRMREIALEKLPSATTLANYLHRAKKPRQKDLR